jgi:hypothetical protein
MYIVHFLPRVAIFCDVVVFSRRDAIYEYPRNTGINCEFSIVERHGRMHTEAAGTVNNIQFPPQPRLKKSLGQAMPGQNQNLLLLLYL